MGNRIIEWKRDNSSFIVDFIAGSKHLNKLSICLTPGPRGSQTTFRNGPQPVDNEFIRKCLEAANKNRRVASVCLQASIQEAAALGGEAWQAAAGKLTEISLWTVRDRLDPQQLNALGAALGATILSLKNLEKISLYVGIECYSLPEPCILLCSSGVSSISLTVENISVADMEKITRSLSSTASTKTFVFRGKNICREASRIFADYISQNPPGLVHLDAGAKILPFHDFQDAILPSLHRNSTIRKLSLKSLPDPMQMEELLQKNSYLHELTIRAFASLHRDNDWIRSLADGLNQNTTLESLVISGYSVPEGSSDLEIAPIFQATLAPSGLKKLSLSGQSWLGKEDATSIAAAIKNPLFQLVELKLDMAWAQGSIVPVLSALQSKNSFKKIYIGARDVVSRDTWTEIANIVPLLDVSSIHIRVSEGAAKTGSRKGKCWRRYRRNSFDRFP